MVFQSPVAALGSHALAVRDLIVEVVRSRHDRVAEAHLVSESRFSMGFSTQWRDLLVDIMEPLAVRGFQSQKLSPGGYALPVVNDCLLYVWRVPSTPGAVSKFASSSTRRNGFFVQPPHPMLFKPDFGSLRGPDDDATEDADEARVEGLVRALGDTMPLVLVMVHSSPRQLQSVEWGVAVLDEAGKVKVHGHEVIWEPEVDLNGAASESGAFDSGTPVGPTVELQKRGETRPNA